MLLIFDKITEKNVIQTYEKTWCKFIRFNNHDFQQILWKWIEESLKDETRMWFWQENEWKHAQEVELTKKKFLKNDFINIKVNRMFFSIVK